MVLVVKSFFYWLRYTYHSIYIKKRKKLVIYFKLKIQLNFKAQSCFWSNTLFRNPLQITLSFTYQISQQINITSKLTKKQASYEMVDILQDQIAHNDSIINSENEIIRQIANLLIRTIQVSL